MSNNYIVPEHLAKLAKLREEGLFCDLQISAHGRRFLAHKCVLAAASPHFMRLLTDDPNCCHFSLPRHLSPDGFARALNYVYTGCLPEPDSVEPLSLAQLHSVACYLRLPALAKACASAMLTGLKPRTVLALRSRVTDADNLLDGIDHFIVQHLAEIVDLAVDCPLPKIKVDVLIGSSEPVASSAVVGDLLCVWFARTLHRLMLDSRDRRRHCAPGLTDSSSGDSSNGDDTDSGDEREVKARDSNGKTAGSGDNDGGLGEFCQTSLAQRLLVHLAAQVHLLYLTPDGSALMDCDQRQYAAAAAASAAAAAAQSRDPSSADSEAKLELASHLPQMRDYIDSRRMQAKLMSGNQLSSAQLPSKVLAVIDQQEPQQQQHQPAGASFPMLLARLGPALCLMSVRQLPVAEDPMLREQTRVRRRSSAQSGGVSFHSDSSAPGAPGQPAGDHFPYMLSPRAAFGVVKLAESILVAGGYNRGQCLRSCEIYCPVDNSWRPGPQLASGPRSRFAAAAVPSGGGGGGSAWRVFACGGSDGVSELATVEEFDGTQWLLGPPMSQARSGCAVAELNGQVFAIGGRSGAASVRHAEWLDPRVGRWQAMPSLSAPRNECCVAAHQGQLWVAGGSDGWSGGCLGSVEVWDPRAHRWDDNPTIGVQKEENQSEDDVEDDDEDDAEEVAPSLAIALACPRRGAAMVSLGPGDLWLVGGSDGHQPALTSCENLAAKSSSPGKTVQLAVPRAGLGLAPLGSDSLLALGGFSGRVFLDSAEILRLTA